MCVNIIYVCTCLYCVICLILYYRSLLICTNKEFMNNYAKFSTISSKLAKLLFLHYKTSNIYTYTYTAAGILFFLYVSHSGIAPL